MILQGWIKPDAVLGIYQVEGTVMLGVRRTPPLLSMRSCKLSASRGAQLASILQGQEDAALLLNSRLEECNLALKAERSGVQVRARLWVRNRVLALTWRSCLRFACRSATIRPPWR